MNFVWAVLERVEQGWDTLTSYPDLFVAVVVLASAGTWWLFRQISKGEVNGLRAQIGVLEERLRFAADRFQNLAEEKGRLEEQVRKLDAQIEDKMPVYALTQTSTAAVRSLNRLDELEKALGASLGRAPRSSPAAHPISS
jgi:hypothetical protein